MNKNLVTPFIVLTGIIIFAYFYFQYNVRENVPGENKFRLANKYLEDGENKEALGTFDEVLSQYPEYKEAHLGRAITLMQMSRFDESGAAFDKAVFLDEKFAAAYANRGILNDRTGRFKDAVSDYRKAIELDPELAEGPGWIWRFLRNIPDKPPSIADRADYIDAELKKPEGERLLSVPELDAQQRMYKK
ncbi:MAG: tetratricopeptide repeat protein [Nitrospirota bacterium]